MKTRASLVRPFQASTRSSILFTSFAFAMKTVALLSLALAAVDAFPFVFNELAAGQASQFEKRDYAQPGCKVSAACNKPILISDAKAHIPSTNTPAVANSKARDNCGFLHTGMCKTFSQAQYVSNTGLVR